MARKAGSQDLFARWVFVVYLPLGLLAVALALMSFGILPGWAIWLTGLLAAYDILPARLLLERRRKGLGIPLPRKILTGVAALSALLIIGIILFVLGMGKVNSSQGLVMVFAGGVLIILAVTVPTFRFIDIILRLGGRMVGRILNPGKTRKAASRKPTVRKASVRTPPAKKSGSARKPARRTPRQASRPARRRH
ncbi:MAG: hypothetical protein ACR2FO_08595 [Actinomycetota bacterium]